MTLDQTQAALLFIIGLLAASMLGIASFHLSDLRDTFLLSPFEEGFALSMVALVGATLGFVIAIGISRYRLQHVLLLGLTILLLSSIASALAPNSLSFLLSRFVSGVGFTMLATVIPGAIARIGDRRARQIALTLWGSYLPAGIAVGIGGCLLSNGDWRASYELHVTACGVLTTCVLILPFAQPAEARHSSDSKRILFDISVLSFCAGFAAFAAIFLVVVGLLPSVLREASGLNASSSGTLASLVCVAGVVTSLCLAIRPSAPSAFLPIVTVGFLGSALSGIILFSYLGNSAVAFTASVVVIVVSALIPSIVFASLPSIVDSADYGPLSGLVAQLGSLGSLLGPPMVTWWGSRFGWSTGWVPFCVLCIAGLMCFWLPGRKLGRLQ